MPRVKATTRRPPRSKPAAEGSLRRIEMTGGFGRREAEALRIEIWGLAQRHGIRLKTLRVESAEES
jgi:hypothetical protein